jgi:hypothetical protein
MEQAAKAQEFLEHMQVKKHGFCLESVLVPSKTNGYIQLSFKGANKFCTLGEMLGWAAGYEVSKPLDQISHRCHNPKCVLPSHVVVESARDNNNRKGCRVWATCPHEGCPDKLILCVHQPSCIKYVPGYDSWEEFVRWNPAGHSI